VAVSNLLGTIWSLRDIFQSRQAPKNVFNYLIYLKCRWTETSCILSSKLEHFAVMQDIVILDLTKKRESKIHHDLIHPI